METTQRKTARSGAAGTTRPNYTQTIASVSSIEQALIFIDAHDQKTWVDCGMAIKSELGDAGFDAWDRWSATADNYRARDAATRWKSFKTSGGITIATLFKLAMDNGYRHNTTDMPTPATPELIAEREAKRLAADAEQAKRRSDAAARASSIWNAPASALEATQPSVSEHPYIKRKGIMPHGIKVFHGSLSIGGMDCNGALMIPMKLNGKISSLQFINCEGEKRFLPDGEKGGFLIGKITAGKLICIAEGFATGASIHEATGPAVVIAFDAGNLRRMAEALRAKNPDARIVLCADDDEAGRRGATEAAQAVGGLLAMPEFNEPRLTGCKDFNDMATLTGLDSVKQAINTAKPVEQKDEDVGFDSSHSIASGKANPLPKSITPLPVVRITCAADIKPEPIRWLWDGWLARGKLHIFAGQAGTGKATIAIALAASVSIGGRFPDGTRAPVGDVLIWSGEDSAQDTLVPRLLAAGANMQRVHFIGDVQLGDELRSFDPATDIRAMTDAATRIGDISLLIVDPVVNAVAGDSHKNGEVRRALQPLVEFGEKLGCAVLGISHFSKGTGGKDPLERVSGSLAFGALARIVLATAKINDGDTTKRIFCRAKSNIGVDHGGFEYNLHQKEIEGHKGLFSSYSVWGQAVEGSARELLAEGEPDSDDGEAAGAEQFLREQLAGGAMPQKEIEQECKGAGFSVATLRRAKKRLGITSRKDGMKGVWFWSLPGGKHEDAHEDAEDAHQNSVSTFGEIEHLREDTTAIVAPKHLRI